MVCQMELSSHLLTAASFDKIATNEMRLAADLYAHRWRLSKDSEK